MPPSLPPGPARAPSCGGLGLTVVTMVDVAEDPSRGTDPLFGIAAAGALLVIGAAVVALLLGLVQRPLLRLFLESHAARRR